MYNDPPRDQGWWQQGPDQNEVAIMSEHFLKEAYGGTLRVRILGLTTESVKNQAAKKQELSSWFPTRLLLPGKSGGE